MVGGATCIWWEELHVYGGRSLKVLVPEEVTRTHS